MTGKKQGTEGLAERNKRGWGRNKSKNVDIIDRCRFTLV